MGNKVLIIEDAKSLSHAIQAELRNQYEIHSDIAYSLAQAKSLLSSNPNQYFIATVDLQLPDCNHGDAVELTHQYSIPSIIFTGQSDTSVRDQFMNKTLVDYVFKTASSGVHYVGWLINRVLLNQQLTVLVVDDSPSARGIITETLKTQGFKVIEADNPRSCMEQMSEKPDLIVIDEFLPDQLGHDLCKDIRATSPDPLIQIIGVSSKGNQDTASFFLKCGANDFIMRPFNQEEFTNRINHRADYIEQVKRLQRVNDEKNRILGMAAHDLRNPLNFIQHAIKRIAKFSDTHTEIAPILSMLNRSTDSMKHLLEDLLDISAIEMGMLQLHKVTYNLSDHVNDRLEIFNEQLSKKHISIKKDIPETAMLEADPSRINQVLDNLISNAIKYSPAHSEIQVTLKKHSDYIRFSIIDSGKGIPKHEEKDLFKPFQCLSNKTTGGESSHGLGLSICLRIINSHNGNIHYEHANPMGSHFYFDLPR